MKVIAQTVWFWIIFRTISDIDAFIHIPPENVAVDIGSSIALNCASNATIVSWSFQLPGAGSSTVLTTSCTLIGSPPCTYRMNTTGSSDCQLIITNASTACAGTYICSDSDGTTTTTKSAMLIVMNNGNPGCSANATNNTQVDESEPVIMNCDVGYTTSYLRPHLNWSRPSDNASSDNSYAYSSIIVTNVIPKIPSDTCRLTFDRPNDPPPTNPTSDPATNAPSYISSCTVGDIFPKYCPLNVNISGAENGSIITNGTITLSCSAEANPLALNIEWQLTDENGTEISLSDRRSPTIPVYYPGYYTCNITNDLPGCHRTATLYITDETPVTPPPEICKCGCYLWCSTHVLGYIICIIIEIFWPFAAVLLGFWIFLCFRHPVDTPPVTWWAHEPYNRCQCWRTAFGCETKNHTI